MLFALVIVRPGVRCLTRAFLQRFVALCYATVCYNIAPRTATKLFLSSLAESDM